jgi:hypothetical protein
MLFLNRMFSKNVIRMKILTSVLIVEMLVREFLVLGDQSIADKFFTARIIAGLQIITLFYSSFVFDLRNRP